MGFDIADFFGQDPCHGLSFENDFGLTIDAGCGVANFVGTIIIDRTATDHGMNVITISDGIAESFQNDNRGTIAIDQTTRCGVKRSAVPVW